MKNPFSKPKAKDPQPLKAKLAYAGGTPIEIHNALVALKESLMGTTLPTPNLRKV